MSAPSVLNSQQSSTRVDTGRVQLWQLAGGQARCFEAQGTTELHITRGRVWATLDGPHAGPTNDLGDRVLQAGDRFTLQRGQRLLVESWSRTGSDEKARLVWVLVPAAVDRSRRSRVAAGSALGAWLAQAGRFLVSGNALGARFARFGGLLGRQGRLQCQAGPRCHSVG